jgi:hypothetical protein
MEDARTELTKPFPFEAELAGKIMRLAELDAMLNMDEIPETNQGHHQEPELDDERVAAKGEPSRLPKTTEAVSAKEKPSLLAALEKNAEKSKIMFGGAAVENPKREEVSV